ncbi:MAG: ABC transporter ATP-binding protein [Candidatus Eiseniibacteriota bacterium]
MSNGFGQVARLGYEEPAASPPRFTRGSLRRIASYFKPYRSSALWITLLILAGAVLGLIPPLLVREVIDRSIPQRDVSQLAWLVGGMIAVPALAGLIGVLQNFLSVRVGQAVMFDIRNDMYQRLLAQSLRFYTNTKSGEILSRLQSDVGGIQGVVTGTLVAVVTNVLVVVTTLIVIFGINWKLSLLAIGILPVFILPTRRVGQIRKRISKETQEKVAELTAYVQETLSVSGHLLVRLFGADRHEAARFRAKNDEVRKLNLRQNLVGRWFFFFLMLFASVGPALIYGYGGYLAIQGALTVGTIVALVAYLGRLYGPASSLVNVHVDLTTAAALFDRIFAYLDLVPEVAEAPSAVRLVEPLGHLSFERVSFEYDAGKPVLEDVSFEARPGELIALVGPSGSGKTTVTYLASRLYDPKAGRVCFDGHDLREVSLESLGLAVGAVTQETFLFHSTVLENLRYAKQDATLEEIESACRKAQILDVVRALPQGFETVVGERGYKLSGGEKQRIAIARVILRNPRLLILDEATSSLDARSEALIQEALATLLSGRTSLVIAHRLSTILAADRILVLDRGRIVEQGTHGELLARGGLYAVLYEQQFRAGGNGEVALPDATGAATPAPRV